MRKIALFGILFLCAQFSFGQDKKIDKLELLYDQGYYAKVLRKSNKLLADPAYDYSGLPSYYKALCLFRLSGEQYWFKKHNTAIDDAIAAYNVFLANQYIDEYIFAHHYEIAHIKTYLIDLEKEFRRLGLNGSADKINAFLNNELQGIQATPDFVQNNNVPVTTDLIKLRNEIVIYGQSFVGVPYVWAGNDESGFDCSGFTSFVLKKFNFIIPRTASGQMEQAKKVNTNNAQKGDLVFFGKGGKITHVGLVVSNKGEELMMVHASTSKGVIVTNVEQSAYWKPKLKGAGTYL